MKLCMIDYSATLFLLCNYRNIIEPQSIGEAKELSNFELPEHILGDHIALQGHLAMSKDIFHSHGWR